MIHKIREWIADTLLRWSLKMRSSRNIVSWEPVVEKYEGWFGTIEIRYPFGKDNKDVDKASLKDIPPYETT